ncbi:metallophosphoesterase [Nocardia sp. NPDC003345]
MSTVTIVQFTDTHIRPAGELMHGTVDTHANLVHALDRLRAFGEPIDALVLSGDLTDTGSREAYRRLRDTVEPVAEQLRAKTIYVMGNHDERGAFAAELGTGTTAGWPGRATGEPGQPVAGAAGPGRPLDQVHDIAGLRVVALDSTTPHRHDGRLGNGQLEWLTAVLREPARHGTLLVLHHPPIPSPVATTQALRLREPERLAEVIAGTDVRLIICGHNHYTGAGALAGVPVWVGPALSYRMDPFAPAGRHRGRTGYGFGRIDLLGPDLVATAVETTPATTIYDRAEQDALDQLAALHSGEG